jgi:hypothetical protein
LPGGLVGDQNLPFLAGINSALYAVNLSGQLRDLLHIPGRLRVFDIIQSGLNENAAQVRFSGRFNLLGVDLQPLTTQTVMAASCAALRRSLESAWFSDGRDNNRSKNKSKGNTNPFHGARTYES